MIRVTNVLMSGVFGGPQRRVVLVARRLRDHGVETTVVIPSRDSSELASRLDQASIPFHRLPLHRITRHRRHLAGWSAHFATELSRLVRVLRSDRADIVHCNGVWQLKAVLAGTMAGTRVALHLNDTTPGRVIEGLYRITAPQAAGLIFAGYRTKLLYEGYRRYNGIATMVIPAPVDTVAFHPESHAPLAAVRDHGTFHVVSAGAVNPAKGYEYFVRMAHLVSSRHPEVRFHVVGRVIASQHRYAAMLEEASRSLPSKALTFHGPSDRMPEVLAAADIYVCSSLREASPMSVWEAMSMGRPLVATDVGDIGRFVEHGINGLIVPPGDARALADEVIRLIEDPRLREALGQQARRTAVEQLDVERCVQRHASFYRELMSIRPTAPWSAAHYTTHAF